MTKAIDFVERARESFPAGCLNNFLSIFSSKYKKAFTLAEVLVTLTIIGVVSALTIPTLTRNVSDKQVVEKVKTAHSILSDAFSKAKIDNGDFASWDVGTYNTREGAEKVKEYFEQYLKTEDGEKDICGEKIASLDGKIKMDYCSNQWSLPIKLQNGMILMFWSGGHLDNHRSAVIVDINGLASPNQYGYDMFQFNISNLANIIYPSGTKEKFGEVSDINTRCNKNVSSWDNGKDCTAWVIYKGNMDYKKRKISWDE